MIIHEGQQASTDCPFATGALHRTTSRTISDHITMQIQWSGQAGQLNQVNEQVATHVTLRVPINSNMI